MSLKTKSDKANLILAVERFPCIWDSTDSEYRVKRNKHAAWEAIAAEVIESWSTMNRCKKFEALRHLVRRWNNIRDYFSKHMKAEALGGEDSYRKKYVFADLLGFIRPELQRCHSRSWRFESARLEPRVKRREERASTASSRSACSNHESSPKVLKIEDEDDSAEVQSGSDCMGITFIDSMNETPEPTSSRKPQELDYLEFDSSREDADLMFLKSLLPDMKKLNDDEKFEFKFAIMQAYKDIWHQKKT